jgi:Adenylate kinase, active site lid
MHAAVSIVQPVAAAAAVAATNRITNTSLLLRLTTARWVHSSSGRVYAYSYNPPKVHGQDDVTGEPLMRRDDDKPEVVLARLAKYEATTVPLLALYTERQVVAAFAGTRSDAIYVEVKAYLVGELPLLVASAEARNNGANNSTDIASLLAMDMAIDAAAAHSINTQSDRINGAQADQQQQQPEAVSNEQPFQQQQQQPGSEVVWGEQSGFVPDRNDGWTEQEGSDTPVESGGGGFWGIFDD